MKRIEKIAIVLIILWVLSLIPNPIIKWIAPRFYPGIETPELHATHMAIMSVQIVLTMIVQIGVAVWLFAVAKRERNRPWVWCLLGMAFGLVAAVLYYLIKVYDLLLSNPSRHP